MERDNARLPGHELNRKIYQAHQQEYLGGMMRAIIGKPQSDETIEQLVNTGMKTAPDIGVAMLIADMFGVNRTPGTLSLRIFG